MNEKLVKRPNLDGVTLEMIVAQLSEYMGWKAMAEAMPVRCFIHDPSVKSSLKFLRRTPQARAKLGELYLYQARRSLESSSSHD